MANPADDGSPVTSVASREPALAFPRIYRVSIGWKIFVVGISLVSAAGGSAGVWYFGTGHEMKNVDETIIFTTLSGMFVVLGVYLIAEIFVSRLILYESRIRTKSIFTDRSLEFKDISGRRIVTTNNAPILWLLPVRPGLKKMKIPLMYGGDQTFEDWIARIPDINATEVAKNAALIAASEASLLQDHRYGDTPERRQSRLTMARRIGTAMNWTSGIIVAWSLFHPWPYAWMIALCAALPLTAIAAVFMSDGLLRIDLPDVDARPNIGQVFAFPAVALAYRANQDLNLTRWTDPLTISAAGMIVLVVLLTISYFRTRKYPGRVALLAVPALLYSYGVTVLANAAFDRSPAQVFEAGVSDKHSSGGRASTSYLRLGPWGPNQDTADLAVPRSLYNLVEAGDTICVYVGDGALGFQWYNAALCR